MDTFDFEKEFSEWVVIREQATPSFSPPNAEESPLVSSPPVRSPVPLRDLAGPSGDVIFSLPDHIVLSVLRYSATDPYALYRTVSLVCKQFSILGKKLPLQLVIRSTIQRLPNCKIVALTVTTPASSEMIKLIGQKYANSLRILKITNLNMTKETQLNEDSLTPLKALTKLRQLSLAWKASPNLGPKAFSFLTDLTKLKKLSLQIYEKERHMSATQPYGYGPAAPGSPSSSAMFSSSSYSSGSAPSISPTMPSSITYAIPATDHHNHTNNCTHCPYSAITPLPRYLPFSTSSLSTTLTSITGSLSPQNSTGSIPNLSALGLPLSPSMPSTTGTVPYANALHPIQTTMTSPLVSPIHSPTVSNGPIHGLLDAAGNPTPSDSSSRVSPNGSRPTSPPATTSPHEPHKSVSATLAAPSPSVLSPEEKRLKMTQSSPVQQHVKPAARITAEGTAAPAPVPILKYLNTLIELDELSLSNYRDFGPLFLLAPLTNIAKLTIKGRAGDLMNDGAEIQDASRHFLFLATLNALRNLTLAWIPTCLPSLVRLSHLDLDQAVNLDDAALKAFSFSLKNLTFLTLDGFVSGGHITDVGVAYLGALPNLTFLDISHHHQVTDKPFKQMTWNLIDLRLNYTSVKTIASFKQFSPSLLHLHLHGCEQLPTADITSNLLSFPLLITFRYNNSQLSTIGGVDEHLLHAYSMSTADMVCLCDRLIVSPRSLTTLSKYPSLQHLELYNAGADSSPSNSSSNLHGSSGLGSSSGSSGMTNSQSKLPNTFEALGCLRRLQSVVFTDITLNAHILKHLVKIPVLSCLTANKVDETSSATAKAILPISTLRFLCVRLSSSHSADVWMKYVVRLPNLTHYYDGIKDPGDLSWATTRRLYLEWHPLSQKNKRTNNCIIQ